MATKPKTDTPTKCFLYCDFNDYIGYCCGVGEIGNFIKSSGTIYSRGILSETSSVDEITSYIRNKVEADIQDQDEEDANDLDGEYKLTANVIGSTPPEWKEYFKNSPDWKEETSFTNLKTGNTVTPYYTILTF